MADSPRATAAPGRRRRQVPVAVDPRVLARLEQRVRGRRLVRGDEQGELAAGPARDLAITQ